MTRALRLAAFVATMTVTTSAWAADDASRFISKARQYGMTFQPPTGFHSVAVVPNPDVAYDYAIRLDQLRLEIRYVVSVPLPEAAVGLNLIATMLNISGGKQPPLQPFPPDAVGPEFGADLGFTSAVRVDSAFGKGFKQCMAFSIWKRGVAQATVMFLYDDPRLVQKQILDATYALRFATK
jgi:hypothetical protein